MGRRNDQETTTPATGTDLVGHGFASILEAARFLAVSRAKVYQLMDARKLAFAKFGRSRRVPWEGLREYARRQLVAAEGI
jgi:excisionase family DNA binding protein